MHTGFGWDTRVYIQGHLNGHYFDIVITILVNEVVKMTGSMRGTTFSLTTWSVDAHGQSYRRKSKKSAAGRPAKIGKIKVKMANGL